MPATGTPSAVTAPTFRIATPDDVAAIVALVESAYRGEASRAGWTTEADFIDGQRTDAGEVAALIARPGSRILLCEGSGELLATAHVERHGTRCAFGMFAVRPTRQGRGLGRRLLAEAERLAADEWGCAEMEMRVITLRHALIAWYERRGYCRTGMFSPFPYGQPRYGLPKRADLHMELLRKPLRRSAGDRQ